MLRELHKLEFSSNRLGFSDYNLSNRLRIKDSFDIKNSLIDLSFFRSCRFLIFSMTDGKIINTAYGKLEERALLPSFSLVSPSHFISELLSLVFCVFFPHPYDSHISAIVLETLSSVSNFLSCHEQHCGKKKKPSAAWLWSK